MATQIPLGPRARGRRVRWGAAALALTTALGGCDGLDRALAVDPPSRLPASALDNPANARLLVSSAANDFGCALGSYIVVGGLLSDELQDATPTAARWSYDRRVIDPSETLYASASCEGLGAYTPLSIARFTADDALRRLQAWTDAQVEDRQRLIAEAAAYAGYSLVLLGEGFCSAAVDDGPELTSAQLFALAEERFAVALAAAQAASDADLTALAYAGRARARIDQGNGAGAAADARLVPEDFVYVATTDETSGRRNNRVYGQNNRSRAVTVAEPFRNLTFAGLPDPRVEVTDAGGAGSDQNTPLFTQNKYGSLSDPIPIASGVEARLIIAEAVGGTEAVQIINELHDAAGLPDFNSADAAAIQAQVREERARELFLQGNRFFDVRRFDLPLVPTVGTDYPKGGFYGDLRCMPLPDVERLNNPNIPDVAG